MCSNTGGHALNLKVQPAKPIAQARLIRNCATNVIPAVVASSFVTSSQHLREGTPDTLCTESDVNKDFQY